MTDRCNYTKLLERGHPYTSLPGVDSLTSERTWSCHRVTHEDHDRCIFHIPAEEKTSEEVKESLLDAINSPNREDRELIGAEFGNVSIQDEILGTDDPSPIDFRFAEFEDLSITGSVIRNPALFDECKFSGIINCRWTRFQGPITATDSTFSSEVTFEGATFESLFNASGSCFEKKFSLSGASIRGNLTLSNCEFHDNIGFWETDFGSGANFSGTGIEGYAAFAGATFSGSTSFSDLTVEEIYFNRCEFDNYTAFFSLTVDRIADFSAAEFHGNAVLDDATFHIGADFTGTVFRSYVSLSRVRTGETTDELLFKEAVLNSGQIILPSESPGYDFTRATVGDVDIDSVDSRDGFPNLRFNQTDFDGFDFSDYRDELEPDWTIHDYLGNRDTPDPTELEVTYLKAKRGAAAVGDAHAEAEFLIKEMEQRRAKYRFHLSNSQITDLSFFRPGVRYVSNLLFDVSCRYGESPRNVVLNSVALIIIFGAIFSQLLGPDDILSLEPLILSLQSFVALLSGGPSLSTNWLRIVSSVEAFFGSFLIALFVFTLTRSVHR